MKIIDKRRFTCRAEKESAKREIEILTSLQAFGSSHFPHLLKITEDEYHHYLVMDYVEGGSLAALRQTKQHLPEHHIQAVARSLLLSLEKLHRSCVAHLNLTLDNILVESNLCDVVLCDFGNAWDFHNANFTFVTTSGGRVVASADDESVTAAYTSTEVYGPLLGSLHYAAPELIGSEKKFGLAADMWSVGVVLFELFCGRLPFDGISYRALKEKIVSGKYQFSDKEWHKVSRGAKQFISLLLHPDLQVRMTVGEALTHPWMTGNGYYPQGIPSPSSKPRHLVSLMQRLWGKVRYNSSMGSNSVSADIIPVLP